MIGCVGLNRAGAQPAHNMGTAAPSQPAAAQQQRQQQQAQPSASGALATRPTMGAAPSSAEDEPAETVALRRRVQVPPHPFAPSLCDRSPPCGRRAVEQRGPCALTCKRMGAGSGGAASLRISQIRWRLPSWTGRVPPHNFLIVPGVVLPPSLHISGARDLGSFPVVF